MIVLLTSTAMIHSTAVAFKQEKKTLVSDGSFFNLDTE